MEKNKSIDEEISLFNNKSILEWSDKWWRLYCFKQDDKPTEDFKRDRRLYFNFFLDGKPKPDVTNEEDVTNKDIDFSACRFDPKIGRLKDHIENLTTWKFRWKQNSEKAEKLKNFEDVEKTYNKNTLVSRIFWSHVFEPLEYPLFDQRTLRTFLLLWKNDKKMWNDEKDIFHPNYLWINNVPSGENAYEFYENVFQKLILKSVKKLEDGREKFILLRKIDWALFAFDKHVIKPCIGKSIPISEPIETRLYDRLNELSDSLTKLPDYKLIP